MERILVAMSGGVDSSVAALLLQSQGFEVVGAYMKNWINEDAVIGHCPWMQDIDDARAVADKLGIEFRVVNLMQDYRRLVVDYLLDGYQRGLTPNPDVMCNSRVKFGVFRAYAEAEGFTALATGHYARRVEDPGNCRSGFTPRSDEPESRYKAAPTKDPVWAGCPHPATGGARPPDAPVEAGRAGPLGPPLGRANGGPSGTALPQYSLIEGLDKNKDQSYFLALLSSEQLRFARFPIGHLPKPELRRLAAEARLPTAAKKDSQGICFIGEVKMADFLKAYVPEHPGPIIRATDGKLLGEHRGLHYYTIGQRRGIRIPSNTDDKAYVVTGKRASDHALLVAFDGPEAPGLWTNECRIHSLSFIGEPITKPCRIECRVRYRDPRVFCEFTPLPVGEARHVEPDARGRAGPLGPPKALSDGGPSGPSLPPSTHIRFDQPQRALASGQIMALYEGERLLGGGVFV